MTPDSLLDDKDRGDDTLKRFRYQIAYSAIVCLSLVDDNAGVSEIFCEHHEDILVKLKDNKFIGIQVKTKEIGLGPFEASEEVVKKALSKFIKLDILFPGVFRRFTIVSNNGFYSKDNTHKNLGWIIELCKAGDKSTLQKKNTKQAKLINSILQEINCSIEQLIETFCKVHLEGELSTLNGITKELEARLNEIDQLKNQTSGVLAQVARKLFSKSFDASSLKCEVSITDDYIMAKDVNEEKRKVIIEGKRITKEIIQNVIKECLEQPITLLSQNTSAISTIPKDTNRLTVKMDKGNVSFNNVNLQKDNKFAAENYFVSWIHKYGRDEATLKYNQIKLIVHNECQSVYDELYDASKPFGTSMLVSIRKRLRERLESSKEEFFGCKPEHLMGMTAILTEECTIWWSEKFDIK